ncbi:hypothetical protein [Borrelia sp. A-FGy1]|nr:hypothetical protein [Borrelia sp. A-FGy1]
MSVSEYSISTISCRCLNPLYQKIAKDALPKFCRNLGGDEFVKQV